MLHSPFGRLAALLLIATLGLSTLSACTTSSAQAPSTPEHTQTSPLLPEIAPLPAPQEPEEPVASGAIPATKGVQPPFQAEDTAQTTQTDSSPSYDFSQPAPESDQVDLSYFDDAAFVGDSRTDGFLIYSGIGRGKNLTSNGLSIFKLSTKKALTIDGESYTLLEALALEQYGKVYLSLGVNELGTYNDTGFYQSYCDAIDQIRAVQPNAVIYIQGLIPLNEDVIAQTTGRTYLTNEHLRVYNDLMRQAAEDKQVVYLDLYSEFVDDSGQLPAEASTDGVHLRKDWCKQWLSYLRTHTVEYDDLYPQAPAPSTSELATLEGGMPQ